MLEMEKEMKMREMGGDVSCAILFLSGGTCRIVTDPVVNSFLLPVTKMVCRQHSKSAMHLAPRPELLYNSVLTSLSQTIS